MDPRMDDHRSVDDQPATTCYRHPERVTGLRCSRCGRPICGECAVPAAVGQLCPDDARDRPRVRRLGDRGRPVVTLSLLAINTALLLVEVALSGNGIGGLIEPSNRALCRLGALNAPAVIQDGQYWRLLTVMVLHAGIIHWAFNSYALFIFGPTLEALLAFFYRRRDAGGSGMLRNLLLVLALNLFIGARIANVDNVAHIGGFLAGLLAMALLEFLPTRLGGLAGRGGFGGARSRANPLLLQGVALAVPFLVGIALVVAAFGSVPTGASCAGA